MKLRNFLIVLFALLIVFAFASCKHEPEVPPTPETPEVDPWELYPYKNYTPTTNQVQVITITEGVETDYWNRDKLKIEWEEPVEAGDVVTLKYRSERTIYQWDIRNGSTKWVYETSKNNFTDPVIGDGGWATLTYTFADVDINGAELLGDTRFGIYFRGNFVEGDVFEIMDVKLNGQPLEIDASNIKSQATLDEETIADHVWDIPRNYAVLLATGKLGDVDKHPLIEKVAPGSTAQDLYDELEEDGGYIVKLFSDEEKTTPYDLSTKILKDALIVYYERTGVERTVKFDLNGGASATAIADATIRNGQSVAEPATIPTKEGLLFAEWCTDPEGTKPYDFSKAVKEDLTLYARYATPRTVKFNTNGGTEIADVQVPDGKPVAKPADPTNGPYAIDDWYLGDTVYDFSTPVTADITIDVVWSTKTTVTLNLNYTGSENKTFTATLYEPLAANDSNLVVDERFGFTFGGWFDEAACTTEHVFTENVEGPITLYAKWIPAKIARITSTKYTNGYNDDKFRLVWPDAGIKAGDTLSITYRTIIPFTSYSIRTTGDEKKFFHEKDSSSTYPKFWSSMTTTDEWTTVTYVFPETGSTTQDANIAYGDEGVGIYVNLLNSKMVPGVFVEIISATLKGEALPIEEENLGSHTAPTLTKDIDCYVWTSHAVTFNTDGGTAISPATVEFGKSVAKPEDPSKDGFVFVGWYADAGFTKAFSFDTPIVEDTEIYAKFGAKKTVTFVVDGGSEVAAVSVASGEKLEQPADPTKENSSFGGWFTDADCTVAYNFDAAVTEDITLYAKWNEVWSVTLNYNYGETPETKVVTVGKGKVMSEPKGTGRIGYSFGGWCDDADGTTPHNFEAAVTENTTLYAKWVETSTTYKFTATSTGDRFQFRWKAGDSYTPALKNLAVGDVFTFQVKFTTAADDVSSFRIRTNENSHVIKETSLSSPVDGWYSVIVVVGDGILSATDNQGIQLAFFGTIAADDVMEIKNVTYNGVELNIGTSSTSNGLYPGASASMETL